MEGVSITFPMRGQNVSLFFQNPLMIFSLLALPNVEIKLILQGNFWRPSVLVGLL